jgi:transcription elongation factor GreA
MAEQIPLTRAGYDQKQARLHYLRTERRQQVAEYLQEAQKTSELNDISLFEDARLMQVQVEAEIAELEHVLECAVIVEPATQTHRGQRGAKGKRAVAVGATVLLQTPRGRRTVMVVSAAEADATQQKISDQSPVGSALLGHGEGETVEVQTPSGPQPYTIVSIS